jgi:hypothetical protein
MVTGVARQVIRTTGPAQVLLGFLFWARRGLWLLPLHMALGGLFVLALLVLSGIAAKAGLSFPAALGAVGWSLLIPVFGMMQMRLLPGSFHWVVQAGHLLIGMLGMVIAARLVRFIQARDQPAPSTSHEALT